MDELTQAENRALYLAWLRSNYPALYEVAVGVPLAGIFDSISNAFSNVVKSVSDALPNLAQTYAQYRTQEQLIKENTRRAQQGLAPLVMTSGGQLVEMRSGDITEDEWRIASTGGGMSTANVMMIAAAVGIGLILLLRRPGRR